MFENLRELCRLRMRYPVVISDKTNEISNFVQNCM